MRDDDETDLRQAFAALRREDAKSAPPFEAVLAGGVGRGRRPLVWRVGGPLVAASLLALLVAGVAVRSGRRPAPMASMEEWTAPTDFLLRTPAREIVETVPRIGARPPGARLEAAAGSGPALKRRSVSP